MNKKTKNTIRTVIQGVTALAVAAPFVVEQLHAESWIGVGAFLAVCATTTRIMNMDVVQKLLDRMGLGTGD